MNQKSELFKEIQTVRFAMYDLLLYLDTHPKDKKAFRMFKELGEKSAALNDEYVEAYGPLTSFDTAAQSSFNWQKDPWPWDTQDDDTSASACSDKEAQTCSAM